MAIFTDNSNISPKAATYVEAFLKRHRRPNMDHRTFRIQQRGPGVCPGRFSFVDHLSRNFTGCHKNLAILKFGTDHIANDRPRILT